MHKTTKYLLIIILRRKKMMQNIFKYIRYIQIYTVYIMIKFVLNTFLQNYAYFNTLKNQYFYLISITPGNERWKRCRGHVSGMTLTASLSRITFIYRRCTSIRLFLVEEHRNHLFIASHSTQLPLSSSIRAASVPRESEARQRKR